MGTKNEILTEIQKKLGYAVRSIIRDKDTFIGTMLMLTVNQPDPDGNCRKLLEYIQANPNVGYDEVMNKADEIVGIENPCVDDDYD